MWQELGMALCLMLVLEGIIPFLQPAGWRKAMSYIATASDGTMRALGLISMLLGTTMLYLIH